MRRLAWSFAVAVGTVAAGIGAAGCQPVSLDSFLYSPLPAPPEGYNFSTAVIPVFQEFSVKTEDGVSVDAVFIPSSGAHPDVTLVYCHGQSNNLGTTWERLELLYPLGYNIEAFDYRGFGKSTGSPSEPGIQMDERAVIDELVARTHVDPKKLVYYGRSFGGAVCIDMAAQRTPGILVEESTFTSVQALISDGANADIPVDSLARSRWDSLSKIPKIPSPFLALHGTVDDYVLPKYSEELVAAHPGVSKLVRVEGADHSNVPQKLGAEEYRRIIADFVETNLK